MDYIERIVNLCIHRIPSTYPFGKPPQRPDFIKNNKYIYGLKKLSDWERYGDALCLFRNIALGLDKCTLKNCNAKAKELFESYCEHFRFKPDEFQGVELEEFPQLENFYQVQLFAMSLQED